MSEEFSFDKKKKLVDRIGKLTNKNDLIIIKEIITKNNPTSEFMKNSNGYFTQFNNLITKTYHDITVFLDKIDKKKMKKEIYDTDIFEKTIVLETSENNLKKKLRLTNTENHVLNRAKYENELKKNENNSDNAIEYFNSEVKPKKQEDIFVSKKVIKKSKN